MKKIYFIIRLLRPYQWIKNILIFPLFFLTYRWNFESYNLYQLFIFFISFSFAASSVYCFNDLIDAEQDRNHPKKKFRPIASFQVTKIEASFLSLLLMIISLCIAYFINIYYVYLLFIYLLLNFFYTIYIKHIFFLDSIFLVSFYLARILSPTVLIDINISYWFISFTFFMLFSLALLKKVIDFDSKFYKDVDHNKDLKKILIMFGMLSLAISLSIITSFLNSMEFYRSYNNFLYLLIPLIMYWNINIWVAVLQNHIKDDPILFAVKDSKSLTITFICLIIFILSTYV